MSQIDQSEILLAQPRGFCAGVDRAINIVNEALSRFGKPIYVRHEIVHNKYVVDELRTKGAVFVEELAEVPRGGIVVFSAHGVSQEVRRDAEARGLQVAQVGIAFRGKRHDYCIVDDDLQPYDLQPTESTNMQTIRNPKGALSQLIAMMAASPSMQPEPAFSPSPVTSTLKRKHHAKGGSHKQNLRASKRGGKQCKQVKS